MINSSVFADVLQVLGPDVRALNCCIAFADGRTMLEADALTWSRIPSDDAAMIFRGECDVLAATWTFVPWGDGLWVTLSLHAHTPIQCAAISNVILDYAPLTPDLGAWWVPNFGGNVHTVGLHHASEITARMRADSVMRGAFPNASDSGLFLATRFPQTHEHDYSIDHIDNTLRFTGETRVRQTIGAQIQVASETTWICTRKTARDAVEHFATHVGLPAKHQTKPIPIGWNSWDYYFSSVTLADMIENMEAIRADAVLRERVNFIVLDMGWEHVWGEWQPNYRFPGGLEHLVEAITSRGFVPGIWTAPICVHALSRPALRNPDILLKNARGDPQPSLKSGHFIVDPTHPAGAAFLRELYSRLHRIGFRLFKVDFVNDLTHNHHFHDPQAGPYDAMRTLFRIIRECVGEESHIIGCSLPAEAGAGVADSGRLGIDIHNQWTHVEWVCDFLQWCGWLHRRVWINDIDFLVVRGRDTSLEAETNVTNPNAHSANPPRWRRGPVFTLDEARTWASMVALSGGNVFLSDRINMLNETAHALINAVIAPLDVGAVPLDLCEDRRASLWLQRLPTETRLTVINWRDEAVMREFDLLAWTGDAPAHVAEQWSEADIVVTNGKTTLHLPAHGCAVLIWKNTR